MVCANITDMNEKWELTDPSPLLEVESIQQMALDWVSGNWYATNSIVLFNVLP